MKNIDLGRGLFRGLGLAAATILLLSSAPQRAEALSLASPGTAPAAKFATDGLTTEVRGGHGGHGGHGGGAAFHGGGFRSGGVAFSGGGYGGHHFAHRHHFHRRFFVAPAYYAYPRYYAYPHRYCRVVWTYYGPHRICRYRHHYRHHYWRHRWHRPHYYRYY